MKRAIEADTEESVEGSPHRRVVLLGASNLTKGIDTVLQTAQRTWSRPLTVLGALGHGRSYGRSSRVLGRELPGILQCRLWQELAGSPRVPTAALVTDIGNDLLYHESVEQIAEWVQTCLDRLVAVEARIVITLLPVETLLKLSRVRYHFFRTIFMPRSRISLEEVGRRAHALNDRLRQLAEERACAVVSHRAGWYGLDPIHIKFAERSLAWREILASWSPSPEPLAPARGSVVRALYLRSRTPEHRRLLGYEQRGRQPAARLRDGTTLAIY